jgi:hypothetical protein
MRKLGSHHWLRAIARNINSPILLDHLICRTACQRKPSDRTSGRFGSRMLSVYLIIKC